MKKQFKKYPLLICLIVSAVLIITSLFIVGFFGVNLGVDLGGGSQIEIVLSDDASSKDYIQKTNQVLHKFGYSVDSSAVEDKYTAEDTFGEYSTRCLLVKIAKKDIPAETKANIRTELAKALGVSESKISEIQTISTSVLQKNIMFLGLAVGIIALALFVFGWIRYDIFAALTFIIAYLHNLILYLSLMILTRIQINSISLSVALLLMILLGVVIVHIFEKYREESRLKLAEKMTITKRMILSEKHAIKPFILLSSAIVLIALLILFVPVSMVRLTTLGIIVATLVTAYTSLLIAPGTYSALLEINDANVKARLSRNDTVNKAIIKKKKKSALTKKGTATTPASKVETTPKSETPAETSNKAENSK